MSLNRKSPTRGIRPPSQHSRGEGFAELGEAQRQRYLLEYWEQKERKAPLLEKFLLHHLSLGCNPEGKAAGGPAWWEQCSTERARATAGVTPMLALSSPSFTAPNSPHCSQLPSLLPIPFTAPNSLHCSKLPSQLPAPLTAPNSPHCSQLPSLPLDTQSLVGILPGAGCAGSPKHQSSTCSDQQPCPDSSPPHKTCVHLVPTPASLTFSSCLHFVLDWKRKSRSTQSCLLQLSPLPRARPSLTDQGMSGRSKV